MTEPSTDDWFPLAELTGRLAGLVWVEQQLGDLFSAWSAVEAHHGVCIHLSTVAGHHHWHAEVLRQCLATSSQLAGRSTPAPPSPGWAQAVDQLADLRAPDQSVSRLAAVVRELDPWLARETNALIELARPVADAALMRWLRFIEIDHRDDGRAMAQLLDALASNTVSLADHSLMAELDLRIRSTAPAPQD